MTETKPPRPEDFELTRCIHTSLRTLQNPPDLEALFAIDHNLPLDLPKYWRAFIHSSFAAGFKGRLASNERLEFLGDTVLGLLVSERLFVEYPEYDEGMLSKLRAALVNEEGLYELSLANELYRFILLGKGELKSNSKKQGPLADLVEALLGAVYESDGIETSERLFDALLENYKDKTGRDFIDPKRLDTFDAKSSLQEKVAGLYGTNPQYVDFEMGRQTYRIDLYINGQKILTGQGQSKKKIHKELAERALKKRLYVGVKRRSS